MKRPRKPKPLLPFLRNVKRVRVTSWDVPPVPSDRRREAEKLWAGDLKRKGKNGK